MTTRRYWAQDREDKIAARIFRIIGTTNQIAVEFGAMDGRHGSNTAHFRLAGWSVRLFDSTPLDPMVTRAEITAENINAVFANAGIPRTFDLLSIDIDGNDLWVWDALTYTPRVVVIEYNPKWGPGKSRTVPYDPIRRWDGTNYYGASVLALCRLGARKGYDLVASTRSNLVFVRSGLVSSPHSDLVFVRSGLIQAMEPESVLRSKKVKRADPQRRKWVAYA